MTGKFKIKIVQGGGDTERNRWLIRDCNVDGEKRLIYYTPSYSRILTLLRTSSPQTAAMESIMKTLYSTRGYSYDRDRAYRSHLRDTETIRKFNIDEYIMLSTFLKAVKMRYNKKRDTFTKI